ncbi:MAG: glycosyltransferase [Candidatus Omnitrophota bacterium]|jgi:glycosyltransferase involved in cell wall biosynthesis
MKLTIVIPAHNEQDNITDVINKMEAILDIPHELVIVNDHSTDSTAALIDEASRRYPNIRRVDNPGERGFANAIKAGFANNSSEAVVPVMADLCDDLNTVKEMFRKINEGYDVVCGARYINGGSRMGGSRIKGFFSCFVGWSMRFLTGIPVHDVANAFKMYRKSVLDKIDIRSKGFEISMELALKAYYLGFKLTELPTVWKERTKGKSSFNMVKLLPGYLRVYTWAIVRRIRG